MSLHKPISTAAPTAREQGQMFDLLGALNKEKVVLQLSAAERDQRAKLIATLDEILQQSTPMPARLLPFGSYALGVDVPGADIDLLCVFCAGIELVALFAEIETRLASKTSYLVLIPEATVPTIKLTLDGVDVDLIFAQIPHTTMPPVDWLLSDEALRGLEQNAVRALNGYRLARQLLVLVPNLEYWQFALKIIKFWAKRRGLYGNSFGYLGGVGYALLMAFVAQLYPCALPATLIAKFFLVLRQWPWPGPIQLNALQEHANCQGASVAEEMVWNAELNASVMPVITPAFPAMNAAYNVNASTRALFQAEFERGSELCEAERWHELFQCTPFFTRYPLYFELVVLADNVQAFEKWLGFVESRISHLVRGLERNLLPVQGKIQPLPKRFETSLHYSELAPLSCAFFIGLAYQPPSNGVRISLTPVVAEFRRKLNEWHGKTDAMALRLQLIKIKQGDALPSFVQN